MEAIQNTQSTSSNSTVTPTTPSTDQAASSGEFDVTLRSFVSPDPANKVNEEELFAALIQERLKTLMGDDVLEKFTKEFATQKTALTKPDGYIPMEDAAKGALKALRDSEVISSEDADSIYAQAFEGAQLDNNKDALFDGKGGTGDSTVALANLETALLSSRVLFEKFDSGELTAEARSVNDASNTKAATGSLSTSEGSSADFLFKPESDSDGKLVVLLPSTLSGLVSSARLLGADGSLLDTGRYGGNGNGGREHFRFSKAGGEYPKNVVVEVELKTGDKVRYSVADPSQRIEGSDSSSSAVSPTNSSTNNSEQPSTQQASSGKQESSKSNQDTSL